MKKATVSAGGETIIVHIPLTFTKRGGRKLVVTPDGAPWAPRPQVDNAMVKALARAFRWRRMLDEGAFGTLEDLARAKNVHATYVSRVLRLTLLAPEIVEGILDGGSRWSFSLVTCCRGFRCRGKSKSLLMRQVNYRFFPHAVAGDALPQKLPAVRIVGFDKRRTDGAAQPVLSLCNGL